MHDGALDLVVLILCLAVLIPFGVKAVIPVTNEIITESNNEVIGDKTVQKVEGIKTEDDYDMSMDIFEVVLTTQVQDYCMPYPRLLTIPSSTCPSEKYHYYTPSECANFDDASANAGCFNGIGYTCTDTIIIDIDSMYKPDVMAYGSLVYKALSTNYINDRYVIEYSYGRKGIQNGVSVENKESYRIHKVTD